MKMTVLFISILLAVSSTDCCSQNSVQKTDSIALSKISQHFFDWYIESVKSKKVGEYSPVAIKSPNGKTTLTFDKYFKNLRSHSFSDSLLAIERQHYQKCIDNLSKIKYTDYLKLQDLSDFENIDCDYDNRYRWTGGQEMFDEYSVRNVFASEKGAVVKGKLYFIKSKTGENRDDLRDISVYFIHNGGRWKISDIKF